MKMEERGELLHHQERGESAAKYCRPVRRKKEGEGRRLRRNEGESRKKIITQLSLTNSLLSPGSLSLSLFSRQVEHSAATASSS